MDKDIRWRQRFHNFEKAFLFLMECLNEKDIKPVVEVGIIKSFECTFELGWKTLKDYLENIGISATSPRDVIKEAFAWQIIKDGAIWLEMLDNRNMLCHTYNKVHATEVANIIRTHYFPAITHLYQELKKKCSA